MKDEKIKELYEYYQKRLSYFALVNNGSYSGYNWVLIFMLFVPLSLTIFSAFYAENMSLMFPEYGSLTLIFLFSAIITSQSLALKWFRKRNYSQLKKIYPEFFNEDGKRDLGKINVYRKLELKKELDRLGISQPQILKKYIKAIESKIREAIFSVGTITAIGAGVISLNWDDIRNVAVGCDRTKVASWFMIIMSIALGVFVSVIVRHLNQLNFGQWYLYKELLALMKEIRKHV